MSSSPPPAFPPVPPVPPQFPPPGPAASGVAGPNGWGLAALIVGAVAFVGAFIPFVNYAMPVLAVVGMVLGIVALVLRGRRKGSAIAGLVLSGVALVLSIVLAIVYTVVFFGHLVSSAQNAVPLDGTPVALVYQVDGTGSEVDISYAAYDSGYSVTRQETAQSLPFEKDYSVSLGGAATYDTYTITAVNGASGGDVTCRILLDGQVLIEQTSTGAYATASCTASATQLLG
ncbi:MmpS family transport accessory protein [Herbiconiux sp. 11R-BC]|uniref:MmpS family transport accessory protein n=1 Tax=Herbiconiux sp. 11R-BC TaxID=3111637 RepID=UPI003BFEC230